MHVNLYGMLYFMLHGSQIEKDTASNICCTSCHMVEKIAASVVHCVQTAFPALEVSVKAEVSRLY